MSVDPKKFGLTPSLVETVKEALKGDQHKIDANKNNKIDAHDFKLLRQKKDTKLVAKPQYDKMRPAFKEEAEQVDELSKKTLGSYATKAADSAATHTGAAAAYGSSSKHPDAAKMAQHQAKAAKRTVGLQKAVGKLTKEEAVTEADDAVAKQIAAKKDAMQKQIQQKIAQKQMSAMQAKANKRLSSINASNDKCSCGTTNESKMKCEVHGDKGNGIKGGKEKIEVNPPLREASDLPKKVVTKGHEIAKSLIKHRAKVREPYAVGMATAKKSAGIKEDAEQVDEVSAEVKKNNPLVFGDKKKSNPLVYGDKKRDNPLVHGDKKKSNPLVHREDIQVDELSNKTLQSYKSKSENEIGDAAKKIRGKAKNTVDAKKVYNRIKGIQLASKKLNKKD